MTLAAPSIASFTTLTSVEMSYRGRTASNKNAVQDGSVWMIIYGFNTRKVCSGQASRT
ncbi:hypothetical protein [Bradyrhizobium sp. Rc2d]|uniref:hypothetical protein n=1 Tax=Bradyrhizobium sp. Rc2d TaxID=1855321 RepID=UPI0015A1751F|nr:hypothetical protein [Bradyrhizobium sp. Rc2d]